MGTKLEPGLFDCLDKAEPDEPYFVLLARDPVAPHVVKLWSDVRRGDLCAAVRTFSKILIDKALDRFLLNPTTQDQINEAEQCAMDMDTWRASKKGQRYRKD